MACPENQHCANCIGTLSFPVLKYIFPNKIYTEAIFYRAMLCMRGIMLLPCVCLSVCHNARVWLAGTVAPLHCMWVSVTAWLSHASQKQPRPASRGHSCTRNANTSLVANALRLSIVGSSTIRYEMLV